MSKINVTEILEYYKQTRRGKKSSLNVGSGYNKSFQRQPWHPSLKYRYDQMRRDSRYQSMIEYNYPRLRGMVVHDSLNLFKDLYLPFLHIRIGDFYKPALLWYAMCFGAYQSIIECCDNMAAGYFPQINFHYERLISDALECLKSHLHHLYNKIVPRLERCQKLEDILNSYLHLILQENYKVDIHGKTIHFQPDWLEIDPEFLYVTEFKTGYYSENSPSFEKDRLQVLLYAYFLESCYFPKKVASVTVHYLGNNIRWEVPFTDTLKDEVQSFIRNYFFLNFGITLPQTNPLKILSQQERSEEKQSKITSLDNFLKK